MRDKNFKINELTINLYLSQADNAPLIVLNEYESNANAILRNLAQLNCPPLNLLCISNLRWNRDMSPWSSSPLISLDEPFSGGADEYLKILLDKIIPCALDETKENPAFTGIAGYSLAGLFALYAMYKCDVFDRVASMSGSLWYPDFKEFALTHSFKKNPDKMYISLGEGEEKNKNAILKSVGENTRALVNHYKAQGLEPKWELNPGNHFKDIALRTAKGIAAII